MITRRLITAVLVAAVFSLGTAPESSAALVQKVSDDFTYQYEFGENQNPTNPAEVDLDGNSAADWGIEGSTSAMSYPEGEGVLRISTTGSIDSCLTSGTSTHLWHNLGLTMDDSFTIEFRSQAEQPVEGVDTIGLIVRPAAGAEIGASQLRMNIGAGRLTFETPEGYLSLDECDNTNDFHIFRIAKEVGNSWWVWRDGVLLNDEAMEAAATPHGIRFIFGDSGAQQVGVSKTDYLRIEEGAFAPLPNIPGDANFDRKVDADDAATLAANWLTAEGAQWADGDFNRDGKVDDADATLMAVNWQVGVNTSAAVPEPSMIIFITGGLLSLGFWRRRKAA